VSLWEAKLAEAVLHGARLPRPAEALRAFFAASSVDELDRLLDDWRVQLRAAGGDASTLERLVWRSQCRILARRLGVHEARRVGAHVFFASRAIDNAKWKPMAAVVPAGLARHVVFDVKPAPAGAGAADGAAVAGTMGVICLRDAACHVVASSSSGSSGSIGGDDDDDSAVMAAVLKLLQPLAHYVDALLDTAVAECDPDKDDDADKPQPATKEKATTGDTDDDDAPRPAPRKRRAKAG
jgi:hypothetical protein